MHVEYRYEMLFFAYLRVIGTLAQVDRLRFDDAGRAVARVQPMNALSIGVTTGFFAHSELELGYSYNFGILRHAQEARVGRRRHPLHWSKSLAASHDRATARLTPRGLGAPRLAPSRDRLPERRSVRSPAERRPAPDM
jgi:hypothetical protein